METSALGNHMLGVVLAALAQASAQAGNRSQHYAPENVERDGRHRHCADDEQCPEECIVGAELG